MTDPERLSVLRGKVRVKASLSRLLGPDLDLYLDRGYAPEVCLESWHLDRLEPGDIKGLAGALDRAGLTPTMHGPFMGLDPGSPHQEDRDLARSHYEACLRAVEVLRPVSAVFHGGGLYMVPIEEKERWIEASLPLWTWLARSLSDLGCRLALENVVDGEPRALQPLVEAVAAHGGGWCFDIGHHRVFDNVGLEPWLAGLGPHLIHMHLHDNHGVHDEHLPLGRGAIDLKRLFSLLARLPEPVATLEVDHRDGVEESLEVLVQVWPW